MNGLEILFGIGFAILSIEKLFYFVKNRNSNKSVGGDGDNNTSIMENSNNPITTNSTAGSAVGSGSAVVNVSIPPKEEEVLKKLSPEEEKQLFWINEVKLLYSNGINGIFLKTIEMSDQDIINKCESFRKTKHRYKDNRSSFTTFVKTPILQEERKKYSWQAKAALNLRQKVLPETIVAEEHLLTIFLFYKRDEEFCEHRDILQSVYKRT